MTKEMIEIFDKLSTVNQKLFKLECKYFGPTRGAGIYRAYKKGDYKPEQEEDFKRVANLYGEKLALESTLKTLSHESVQNLYTAARSKQPVTIDESVLMPASIAFLMLYLGIHLNWYEIEGEWYFYTGDQPAFIGETFDELKAFIYGMAYSLAALPDGFLEQVKRPLLR